MGFFADYMEGVAMRKNPQLLQQKIAGIEANKMAEMADQVYGSRPSYKTEEMMGPAEFAQPAPTRQVLDQAGTGMFEEGISDQMKAQLMNKRMLGTGLSGFNKQWAGNQANMQNSAMSGMQAMAKQRQQQQYDTANPSASTAGKMARESGFTPGTPGFKKFVNDYATKSGVTVNTGGSTLTPGWMSDEQKASQGIPLDTPIWTNTKGDPKVIAAPDAMNKKTTVALDQLEQSTATLNNVLDKYDPNSLAEITTSLLPMPTAIANQLRNETERTVSSAKKGWQELILRDATGAVINESEYGDYDDIYMPQPGEGKAEWERKAKLRHSKENAYRRRVGAPEKEYVSPYAKKGVESSKQPPPGLTEEQWNAGRARGDW